MPMFGLAAFRDDDEKVVRDIINKFLDLTEAQPLRHIEISELYCNGHVVLDALKAAGLQRSDMYLTYKIWPKSRGARDIVSSCTDFLELIEPYFPQTYFDLILIHAPIDIANKFEQWTAVEFLKEKAVTKSIGICSYTENLIVELMKNCVSQPVVCEAEVTPFGQDHKYVEYCVDSSIVMLCNNIQAKQLKFNNATFCETASRLNLSPLELHIQWVLSKGFAILLTPRELEELNDSFSLPLTKIEKKILASLDDLNEDVKTSVEFKPPKADDDA